MRGVLDLALLPIGGTNEPIIMSAVPLNFEVKGSWYLHNGHTVHGNKLYVNIIIQHNIIMYGYT